MCVVLIEDHIRYLLILFSSFAGDGKTHYIKKQLRNVQPRCKVTIAVNEAFSMKGALQKLQSLPIKEQECVIYFNFTLLLSEVDMSSVIILFPLVP